MDQDTRLVSAPALIGVLLCLALVAAPLAPARADDLADRLERIDTDYPGELGIYVSDLASGERTGLRADETWYLASTVKIAVAVTLLQAVDAGELSLNDRVTLEPRDYVDGAGETNWRPPGEAVSLRYLFEQMLVHSDNTATDVLLRHLGEDAVNALVRRAVGPAAGRFTTLADVRRHAYSEFHPAAMQLDADGFFTIRKAGWGEARVMALAGVLGLPREDFNAPDLDTAFERYYRTGLNSAPLADYAGLLEALARGELLAPDSRRLLLTTLARIETGDDRIKAGLPQGVSFIHKTGTQHRRACNLGIAVPEGRAIDQGVIIAACARGVVDLAASEAAFRALGEAVAASGWVATTDSGH